ncbi:MAG: hypothetical protein MUP08_09595 [Desulfobulbaceae bacterium]|nr:hypothetical protein [Desulfobulbaceae bacterium]
MSERHKSPLPFIRDIVKTTKKICPNCEKRTNVQYIKATEEITVKGEGISVPVEYYRCIECGDEFEDPKSNYDPLALAFKEYRRRHATGSF